MIPVINSFNADPGPMSHTSNVCLVPQTARQLVKPSYLDLFPWLMQVGPSSNDVEKYIRASFLEREVSRHTVPYLSTVLNIADKRVSHPTKPRHLYIRVEPLRYDYLDIY